MNRERVSISLTKADEQINKGRDGLRNCNDVQNLRYRHAFGALDIFQAHAGKLSQNREN